MSHSCKTFDSLSIAFSPKNVMNRHHFKVESIFTPYKHAETGNSFLTLEAAVWRTQFNSRPRAEPQD